MNPPNGKVSLLVQTGEETIRCTQEDVLYSAPAFNDWKNPQDGRLGKSFMSYC